MACHLINVFGPKTPSRQGRRTGPFYRVPPSLFAKMFANYENPMED